MNDPACYFHRDGMGFCLLENNCWAEKPCPKSQKEADAARAQVIEEIIARRPRLEPSTIPPRPCHAVGCGAPAAPGLDMCRGCLAKFSPGTQARIAGK